ncbi:MAG: PaaI family thioesterase [Defluviicoccus sp.]|nr:PaaI family thioesterase [Defluviicoccus sp.]
MAENVIAADELQERLVAAPFNAWMGLRILSCTEDGIEIGMTWREEMISNPRLRITHGGIIGAVVDVAADYAVAAKLGVPVPTVDLRVDYHRAARPGDLVARGRVVRLGGTNAVAEASVRDGEDRLIASGRGVYFAAAAKS